MKPTDLFAGLPVVDYERALAWYRRLLDAEPSFFPNDIEAVWEVGEHRYLYIERVPDRAGHSMHMLMVEDIDKAVAAIAERGIEPDRVEHYEQGMRKVIYRDPDGNEISFGGVSSAS